VNTINPWILLTIAILGELAGTSFLKFANGWERPWAWAGVAVGFGTALVLLASVIQRIDISVVYAIWSGVGIALVAVVGIVVFHETMTWTKAAGLLATLLGIVLLQLQARH
jgi:small multidrug resistance pump